MTLSVFDLVSGPSGSTDEAMHDRFTSCLRLRMMKHRDKQ